MYPTNAQCWNRASPSPVGLGIDAIIVFAYAAQKGRLPDNGGEGLGPLQAFQSDVYAASSKTGIDPVYFFGFLQSHTSWPDIPALNAYLDQIGVRREPDGKLAHNQPGSPHGMIRPGPGDGYVGNGAPTDPGIACRPWTPDEEPIAQQVGCGGGSASSGAPAGSTAPVPVTTNPISWFGPPQPLGGAPALRGHPLLAIVARHPFAAGLAAVGVLFLVKRR